MGYVKDALALVISAAALIVSICNFRRSKTKNYLDFLMECDSEEQRRYRREIYDCIESGNAIEKLPPRSDVEKQAANVIAFYNKWATLYRRKYLPKWTFDSSEGQTLVGMYQRLEKYILKRREETHWINLESKTKYIQTDRYGDEFENLAKSLQEKFTSEENVARKE